MSHFAFAMLLILYILGCEHTPRPVDQGMAMVTETVKEVSDQGIPSDASGHPELDQALDQGGSLCGSEGEECCSRTLCQDGLECVSGRCETIEICGRLGAECCQGDCEGGVCLNNHCVTFGGAFAVLSLLDELGMETGEQSTFDNPITQAPSCPSGFEEQLQFYAHSYSETSAQLELKLCLAPQYLEGDFQGSSLQIGQEAQACEPICINSEGQSTNCSCPAGSLGGQVLSLPAGEVDLSGCPATWSWCGDSGDQLLTFGGTFVNHSSRDDCGMFKGLCLPNPYTGECDCPTSFNQLRIPLYHEMGSTGDFCESTLSICIKTPPY